MTAKQRRFVEEYLIDLNATQAAIRAGYKVESAQQMGSENLSKPVINTAIERAMAAQSRRTGVTADRVIRELARIAFVNPNEVIDTRTGGVRQSASPDDLAAIQAVKVKQMDLDNGTSIEREVRLNDKMKALELLGKHLGMFKDKVDVGMDGELKITVDYGEGSEETE